MYDENSGLVRAWVDLIRKGYFTTYDIPELGNLKDVVMGILGEDEK